MSAEPTRFLRTLPLFAGLSDSEVAELSWAGQAFRLEAGEFLFRQDAAADDIYCVESGRLAISIKVGGSVEKTIAYIAAGSIVGESALVDGGIRSASACATEPTRGWCLHRRGFDALRAAYRPSAAKVLRQLAGVISDRIAPPSPAPQLGRGTLAARIDLAPFRQSTRDLNRQNLQRLSALKEFTPDELEEFLAELNQLHVPRGTVLFREGDPQGSCFITVRGAVEVCIERDGTRRKLALQGPGGMFGEASLFTERPRGATCWARENTTLLELERPTFERLFQGQSVAVFKFFEAAVRLLVELMRRAALRQAWFEAERHGRSA